MFLYIFRQNRRRKGISMIHKQKAFRFGVIDESSITRETWLQNAKRVEQLGYSTLLIRDHFIHGGFNHQLAPVPALMAAADATNVLRVGSLVFSNDYRHPVLLAKEAATLDVLSNGRFELGIGAGWLKDEYEQIGLPFNTAGIRVERLQEALHVLRGLFTESPFTFAGKHYTITNLESFPKPLQKLYPPILVGAGGKRMLSIAAQEADIIGILPIALSNGTISDNPAERLASTITQKIGWIRDAAGDRFEQIELNIIVSLHITQNRQHRAEQILRERLWGNLVNQEDVLDMPSILIGSVEEITEKLYALREQHGLSYFVIPDSSIEEFAPVVAQLAGK